MDNTGILDWDIDESNEVYNIDKLVSRSDPAVKLWTKHLTKFKEWSRFWAPRLEIGKKCHAYMRRDIFSAQIRKNYADQGKIPIEPQEMKATINTLMGLISERVKPYSVVAEDKDPPPNAATPDVMNVVLKWLTNRMSLEEKQTEALREGLIDGYPQWLVLSKPNGLNGSATIPVAHKVPWESVLCSPTFMDKDGSDVHEIFILHKLTKAELAGLYPERIGSLDEHDSAIKNDPGWLSSAVDNLATFNSEDRKNWIFDMVMASNLSDNNGRYTVVEHLFSVRKKVTVYLNIGTGDALPLPAHWSEQEIESWRQSNPEFRETITNDVSTLWVTTFGVNGFIWENRPHWFQVQEDDKMYSKLPAEPYIASLEDHLPQGVGEDMLPYIFAIAVSETEGLHEVRTGTGSVLFGREGDFIHPSRIKHEVSSGNGVVLLKKTATELPKIKTRTPNETFMQNADRLRSQMTRAHNITEVMMGISGSRQSSVAKEQDITQGMSSQSQYLKNYDSFVRRCAQLLCYMVPYFITEAMTIQIKDEYGRPQPAEPVTVQDPQDFNPETGEPNSILNDLTAVQYRIVPTPGDDSPTSREKSLKDFAAILRAIGNTIFQLPQDAIGNIFMTFPNPIAQETGKYMIETAKTTSQAQQQMAQQQQQAEINKEHSRQNVDIAKATTPKVQIKLSPTDFVEAPEGVKILMEYANQQNQQQVVPVYQNHAQDNQMEQQQQAPAAEQGIPVEAMQQTPQ